MKYLVIKASFKWRWCVQHQSSWMQGRFRGLKGEAWILSQSFKWTWNLLFIKWFPLFFLIHFSLHFTKNLPDPKFTFFSKHLPITVLPFFSYSTVPFFSIQILLSFIKSPELCFSDSIPLPPPSFEISGYKNTSHKWFLTLLGKRSTCFSCFLWKIWPLPETEPTQNIQTPVLELKILFVSIIIS